MGRQNLTQTTIKAFTGILTVAVITVGAVLVVDGHLDIGEMIGANILAARALHLSSPFVSKPRAGDGLDQAKQTIDDFERVPFEKMDGSAFEAYSGTLDFKEDKLQITRAKKRRLLRNFPYLLDLVKFYVSPAQTAQVKRHLQN